MLLELVVKSFVDFHILEINKEPSLRKFDSD